MSTMLTKAITIISTIFTIAKSCDFYLGQSDFQYGTVKIQQSGTYCLTCNVEFNPLANEADPNAPGAWFPTDDNEYEGSEDQIAGAYILGFFAAIAIEANDVIIDLQGYELKYSFEFYLQQRWGSIIEIANAPFLPSTGPGQFEGDVVGFIPVDNIEIKNGKLGLSSHHGIHSNGASNVVIRNLEIYDFEVAAIQLNGFDGATLENLKLGPALQEVPLTGYYSNGRFIILALRQILQGIDDEGLSMPSITFNGGRTLTLQEITDNLVESMDLVFRVLTGGIKENKKINGVKVKNIPAYIAGKALFINEEGLPDGSAIYGILANSKAPAIAGFGVSPNDNPEDGQDLTINDVTIEGLKLLANEIPVLSFDKCDGADTITTIQGGPFGDVFDLRKAVCDSDAELIESHASDPDILDGISYVGNPLADAQIAMGEFFDYIPGKDFSFVTQNIDDRLISWAKGDITFPSSCADFVCNGDIMFHTNKGIAAARIDGIENVQIIDLVIKDLVNESPLVSCACGNYSGPHNGGSPGQEDDEGGMGTDIRGIVFSRGDAEIIGIKSKISQLDSYYGDTTGIDIINDATVDFDVGADITIRKLKSASKLTESQYNDLVDQGKTPYPNNFDLCTIEIEDTSTVTGDVPQGKESTDCIDGTWNNKVNRGLVSADLLVPPPQNIVPNQFQPNMKYQPQQYPEQNYYNNYNKYNSYQPRDDEPTTVVVDGTTFEIICGALLLILLCNVYVMYKRCKGDSTIVKYAGIKQVGTDTEDE